MINDSPTGTVSGGLGVTQALTNGPINIQTGSQLLDVLWYQNPVSVNVINNPVGAGTQTGLVNGVETVKVDPSICPGAPDGTLPGGIQQSNASPNINELSERIGHELVHAEVPNADSSWMSATRLGQAVQMGELNEGAGYTAQYIIAEQLNDISNTEAKTSFAGLNAVFNALQSLAASLKPNFGSINSIADLTSSAFYMTEAAYL
jgi:hypothetical protein